MDELVSARQSGGGPIGCLLWVQIVFVGGLLGFERLIDSVVHLNGSRLSTAVQYCNL